VRQEVGGIGDNEECLLQSGENKMSCFYDK
jgi:hypothetical protein